MATVKAKYPGENVESMMRRFRKKVEKEGVLDDMRKHEFYKKPSIKAREKSEAARKRAAKAERKRKKFEKD